MSIGLIVGIAVIALIVAIALSQRARGAHVTTIERNVEERDVKDSDDA